MLPQADRLRASFVADITLIRSGVYAAMLPQAGRLRESLVADITLIRLLLRVYVGIVTLLGSLSVPDVALIRSLHSFVCVYDS